MQQAHLGFRERQLERSGGVAWLFEKVLDRPLQAVGDDPQVLRRRLGAAQLNLVEEGSAEVVTGDGGQAQPEFLPSLPDPPSERTRRCGVIR